MITMQEFLEALPGERNISTRQTAYYCGKFFKGHGKDKDGKDDGTHEYYNAAWNREGYWLVDLDNPGRIICISEAAISRSFHEIHDTPDGGRFSQWGWHKSPTPHNWTMPDADEVMREVFVALEGVNHLRPNMWSYPIEELVRLCGTNHLGVGRIICHGGFEDVRKIIINRAMDRHLAMG